MQYGLPGGLQGLPARIAGHARARRHCDYLASNSVEKFIELLGTQALVRWQPKPKIEISERRVLEYPSRLAPNEPKHKVYLLDGLIEKWSRGMIIGPPKGGKTLGTLDLSMALSTGGSG